MLALHTNSASRSSDPRSSVVIGADSRPQPRGAGPSRLAVIGPPSASAHSWRRGPVDQRRQPALGSAHVVVHERDQRRGRRRDAGVARGVGAPGRGMALQDGSCAAAATARGGVRGAVVDHDQLEGLVASAGRPGRPAPRRGSPPGRGWGPPRRRRAAGIGARLAAPVTAAPNPACWSCTTATASWAARSGRSSCSSGPWSARASSTRCSSAIRPTPGAPPRRRRCCAGGRTPRPWPPRCVTSVPTSCTCTTCCR